MAVAERVDIDATLALLQRAVATPSVTGDEGAFARLVAAELEAAGADVVRVEEAAPGRPIVWSLTRGSGSPSVMFAGHLDTVRVTGWRERWPGDPREDPFSGAIVDGALWGRGACDLKAGIASVLGALHALRRASLRPRGDVVTAWVADEESGEPGLGRSVGMKAIVERIERGEIPRTDFAVYVEPTALDVYAAQMGFFIAEIRIEGRSAYFGTPSLGVDALRAAHRVLGELWRHSGELEQRGEHSLVGRAFLLPTGISGGGYVAVPGDCTIGLIRKVLPGEDLDAAARELEDVVARALDGVDGIRHRIELTAPRDHRVGGLPAEAPLDHPGVRALLEQVRAIAPERGRIAGAPFWSEMSFLSRLGIPCVYFAPGDITVCHTVEERVAVEEVGAAVRILTSFLGAYCGVESR